MDCMQYTWLPCPSPTHRACSNSCLLSRWCYPTISTSVGPFSSCLQSFPASGSFPMSQLFASGGQSIWVSASASILPMNTQDWSPLGWTGWSPCSARDSQESSPTPQFKSTSSSELSLLYGPTLISKHDYWKKHSFDYTLGQKRQHGSQRPQVSEKNSIQDPEDHWEQFAQLALHWNYLHVLYAMLHGFISILSSVLNFFKYVLYLPLGFPHGSVVKNLPAMQEMQDI